MLALPAGLLVTQCRLFVDIVVCSENVIDSAPEPNHLSAVFVFSVFTPPHPLLWWPGLPSGGVEIQLQGACLDGVWAQQAGLL